MYPLYRIANKIYVRNHALFQPIYKKTVGKKAFTPQTCYQFVAPRRISKESEEYQPAEWVVNVE